MPLVAYGHAGQTLLMFPTAAADYLEYERFHLVDAIKPLIDSGKLRAYSINSVNKYSLLNEQMPPHMKAELLTRFDRYITEEVLPLIRNDAGPDAQPLTTGASLGAFLAANAYFKHPDLFRGVSAMSGSVTINAVAVDGSGNPVLGATLTYCSDNLAVANMSGSTLVPSGPGTATITICNGSVQTTITVNVTL